MLLSEPFQGLLVDACVLGLDGLGRVRERLLARLVLLVARGDAGLGVGPRAPKRLVELLGGRLLLHPPKASGLEAGGGRHIARPQVIPGRIRGNSATARQAIAPGCS